MSNYEFLKEEKKNQHLFIVEGDREKNEFLNMLFQLYPEMGLSSENTIVYGTNIYVLYREIVKEYGKKWYEDEIDIPLLVWERCKESKPLSKRQFTSIIMIFDYERHDPYFSEQVITVMQKYFNEQETVGKLYINYPMLESYVDYNGIPDPLFMNKKIQVNQGWEGSIYKNEVKKTIVSQYVNWKSCLSNSMKKVFDMDDENIEKCINEIFRISSKVNLKEEVESIIQSYVLSDNKKEQARHYLYEKILCMPNLEDEINYYSFLRKCFNYIIYSNLCKAYMILEGKEITDDIDNGHTYEMINLFDILCVQNNNSRSVESGFIYILNTSIMMVLEYNTRLIEIY